MVRLNKVTQGIEANVLVKLEYLNPSGSIKDRIALRIIEEAERASILKPHGTIVESSSGNTAIALSFVGAVKGYDVKIFLPKDAWIKEKRKTLDRFGAEVELVPRSEVSAESGVPGFLVESPGRVKCQELEDSDPSVFWARQVSNPDNVAAHNQTGREILEQTDGNVDVFVAAVGTGGTLLGVAQVLKEALPHVRIVAVEPTGWEGHEYIISQERVEGVPSEIIRQIKTSGIVDEVVRLGNEETRDMAYRLSSQEGLFCGMSSGANVFVAIDEARKLGKGKNVVTVLVDRGDRYFSDERFIT